MPLSSSSDAPGTNNASSPVESEFSGEVAPLSQRGEVFDLVAIAFVAFLLISNIAATKVIELDFGWWKPVFDGGAVLFPLTYILGDVLAEVYGFARTRRVIMTGFVISIIASLTFWIVQIAPPGPGYENQAAFEAVLGFVPRIVIASLCGYLFGQLLNSWVLVKIRQRLGDRRLWVRLIGSTMVGEAADTIIFCTIAFYGVIPGWSFVNYLVVGYLYKLGVEVVFLPLTYQVMRIVKKKEGIAV